MPKPQTPTSRALTYFFVVFILKSLHESLDEQPAQKTRLRVLKEKKHNQAPNPNPKQPSPKP